MNILITGIHGFVGSNLVVALKERHSLYEMCIRDRFYIGNVRDRQSVDGAMMGVDYVFSAAALKPVSYTHLDVYKRQIKNR